ncbi:MAG: hypothetical protein WC377_06250 [Bacteroidales bacterium]|jgi:hypothetical protein|nr:hypothetical protein [Bacteroidales bacterium]MDD2824307.1 hypothetical protein [Bacteroidales bacterium]MDD3101077.1 hypothetical protein [Bacteroidales bacterium]MDD3639624.1 hypothetical protein [Bacteroidales bacterium]MDD3944412.1 hypothetical protein [Bacteroidales bacterium]
MNKTLHVLAFLSGIVLFAGCTIQEVPFEYSAAQAQVLARLDGNIYLAQDPDDEDQTATLMIETLYMPPHWTFVLGRGFTVYGIMAYSKFMGGELNEGYPLQLYFNLSKDGEQMTLAIAPDYEMLGEIVIDFPSETSLRMTIESLGEMVFNLVEE